MTAALQLCWICGDPATTGEHKSKHSDLKAEFGNVTQAQPVFMHDKTRRNIPIGSLKNDRLKFPDKLCARCNNERTQPHDRAWEQMSAALRAVRRKVKPGKSIQPKLIFFRDTPQKMLDVHLYFVKLFGGVLLEGKVKIDMQPFANAILTGTPHPAVFIKFGQGPTLGKRGMTGRSDLDVRYRSIDGSCAAATWIYNVGGIAVNVMYAEHGMQDGHGWWHPSMGTDKLRLRIDDLSR